MYIDLHTHSYFSDGELSPLQMVKEAKKQNISVFSITEHNFISNNKEAKEFARYSGIKYINGIEISTTLRLSGIKKSLHVLGYGANLNMSLLNKGLFSTINGYNERARSIIKKLNKIFPGINLNFNNLKKNHEAYVSRNTLARLVLEHLNQSISLKEILKRYVFTIEDDSWMMTPEQSFSLISKSGGISVLAHSGRELRNMGLDSYKEMILKLAKLGLKGIEVYFPKHTHEEIKMIKSIANMFDLYITAGSDWHGPNFTPNIVMGRTIPSQYVNRFLKAMS